MGKKSNITIENVKKAADLIKIHLSLEEEKQIANQLNAVIEAVEVLNEIDTSKVKITTQTHGLTNVFDEDVATPALDLSQYKNNNNFKNGYFVVNQVI